MENTVQVLAEKIAIAISHMRNGDGRAEIVSLGDSPAHHIARCVEIAEHLIRDGYKND